MKRFIHPLLLLLARATEKELVKIIEYLKTENQILRSKLPKRIELTEPERNKLIKLGTPLSKKLKEVITIVTYRMFLRWCQASQFMLKPAKRGRPRKPEEIRSLIVRMALETGWGFRRILGEIKKLRIRISKATIARILRENGFDIGPKGARGPGPNSSHGTSKPFGQPTFSSKRSGRSAVRSFTTSCFSFTSKRAASILPG